MSRLKLGIFYASFLMLGSCASLPQKTAWQYWPEPPAEPRLVYESTLRNENSLKPSANTVIDQLQQFANGVPGKQKNVLLKPYDIAAHGGLIAVSDSLRSIVHVFDVPRKKLFQIGWRGEGKLVKPLGLTIDIEKNIYVADAGLGYVVKFDQRGHYLGVIGRRGDFNRINDVAVDSLSKRVYVLDRGGVDSLQHRVIVYDLAGSRLMIIGTRGHGDGEFNHPSQLAVGQQGELFVLDAGNFRVQIFDKSGKFIRRWGKLGKQLGNFARPRGIAVDKQNNVYVTDSAYQNFQIFNQTGQLLLNVGSASGTDKPADYILPAGIATDETDRIYVVDQIWRKVEIFRLLSREQRKRLVKK